MAGRHLAALEEEGTSGWLEQETSSQIATVRSRVYEWIYLFIVFFFNYHYSLIGHSSEDVIIPIGVSIFLPEDA
jgi:hypothetical protein